MALTKDGIYVRVISGSINASLKTVGIETWKDKETRDNPTQFDKAIVETVDVPALDLTVNADASKSIVNNETTAAYLALKALERFAGYTDA